MPGPRSSLVILDCDGVLVDSEHLLLDVRQQVLAELGVHLERAEMVTRFVGTPHRDFVGQIEELTGQSLPPDWEDDYKERCRQVFEKDLVPVTGIVAALDAIDLPMCVASSGSHEKMRLTLGITGLLPRFEDVLFSANDVERGKPFPDLFLHAAQRMGFRPDACVVVEDSEAGVAAALAAGMGVVAFAGSVTARRKLMRPGVQVIDAMVDLPAAIATLTA